MKIDKINNGNELIVKLDGRLDTNTASDLEQEVKDLTGINSLVFDFEKLEYISSAGLRVLLACQKKMNILGKMVIKNADDSIKEIFEITGFSDILTIE